MRVRNLQWRRHQYGCRRHWQAAGRRMNGMLQQVLPVELRPGRVALANKFFNVRPAMRVQRQADGTGLVAELEAQELAEPNGVGRAYDFLALVFDVTNPMDPSAAPFYAATLPRQVWRLHARVLE